MFVSCKPSRIMKERNGWVHILALVSFYPPAQLVNESRTINYELTCKLFARQRTRRIDMFVILSFNLSMAMESATPTQVKRSRAWNGAPTHSKLDNTFNINLRKIPRGFSGYQHDEWIYLNSISDNLFLHALNLRSSAVKLSAPLRPPKHESRVWKKY